MRSQLSLRKLSWVLIKGYPVNVFYSAEDKGYIADIPKLKHCSAFGKTRSQAVREIVKAQALWIETFLEAELNLGWGSSKGYDVIS